MTSCPSELELETFLAEGLPELRQVDLTDHIESCTNCQDRLEHLCATPDEETPPVRFDSEASVAEVELLKQHLREHIPLEAEPPAEAEPELQFPEPPTAMGPLGKIGPYHVCELIASGGTGIVYRAIDEKLQRTVALKVLKRGLAVFDEAHARFQREARAAAALQHDHVVAIHDVVDEAGFPPYLVLEFVEGESLANQLQRKGACPPRLAAEWTRQIALGLAASHAHGLIHRDVKPSNILIDGLTGRAKLTDFGLAREALSELTQEGVLAGTPTYMSPEQIQQPHTVDERSDVYSLGVVLYECLTGVAPFSGQLRMVLLQVLHDEPRPPRRLNDRIPVDLETICLKAMSKEPHRRYTSAKSLAQDLELWLKGEPVLARPLSQRARLWRWCLRNRGLAVLSGSAVWLMITGTIGASLAAFSLADANNNLRQAQEIAQRQVLAAASQRDLALDTMQRVVTEVQDRLGHQEGQADLQQQLLLLAMEGLERVADANKNIDSVDFGAAAAHLRLSETYAQLGELEQAESHLHRSDEVLNTWEQLPAWQDDVLQIKAMTIWQRGELRLANGGWQTAWPHFQQAVRLSREVARMHREDPRVTQLLTEAYERWTRLAVESDRRDFVLPLLSDALVHAQMLVAELPDDHDAARAYALLLQRRALWLARQGEPQAGATTIRLAVQLFERRRKLKSLDQRAQRDWGMTQIRYAEWLWYSRKNDLALKSAHEGLAVLKSLGPNAELTRIADLAEAQAMLGQIYLTARNWSSARESLTDAAELLSEIAPRRSTTFPVLQRYIHVLQNLERAELHANSSVQATHPLLPTIKSLLRHESVRGVPERQAWLQQQIPLTGQVTQRAR